MSMVWNREKRTKTFQRSFIIFAFLFYCKGLRILYLFGFYCSFRWPLPLIQLLPLFYGDGRWKMGNPVSHKSLIFMGYMGGMDKNPWFMREMGVDRRFIRKGITIWMRNSPLVVLPISNYIFEYTIFLRKIRLFY